MDSRFLESACEAYIIENNLYETHTSEQLFKDVYKSLYFMRKYHPKDSNIIESYDKINQQLFLIEYFNLTYPNVVLEQQIDSEDDILNEEPFFTTLAIGAMTGLIAYLFAGMLDKPITAKLAPIINGISKNIERVGKFLTKGKYWKVKYAIIQKNFKKSYIHCGVNPKFVSYTHYSALKDDYDGASSEVSKQSKCLRDEYIRMLTDQIALLLKSYFVCLKRTGNFDSISNIEQDKLMHAISLTSMSTSCQEYHDMVKKSIEDFNYIIDTFIDRSNRQKMIDFLIKKISFVKKEIQYAKNLKKYK